jgi:K+-sensing histidine kinase KdpD
VADTVEEEANTSSLEPSSCNIHERVLVCVSTYSNSVQLLRRGARIANYMNAKLYGIFVADPEQFLSKKEASHIDTCEKLCREFGGEFLKVKMLLGKLLKSRLSIILPKLLLVKANNLAGKDGLKVLLPSDL